MTKKIILVTLLWSFLLASCTQTTQTPIKNIDEKQETTSIENTKKIQEIIVNKVPTEPVLSEEQVNQLKTQTVSSEGVIKESDETIEKLRQEMQKQLEESKKLDASKVTIE